MDAWLHLHQRHRSRLADQLDRRLRLRRQLRFNIQRRASTRVRYEIQDRFTGVARLEARVLRRLPDARIGLFYEGRSGRPYSYIFNGDANGDGRTFNDLFYVPRARATCCSAVTRHRCTHAIRDGSAVRWLTTDADLAQHRGQRTPTATRATLELGQHVRPALQPGAAGLLQRPQVRGLGRHPQRRQPDQQGLGPHRRLRLQRQPVARRGATADRSGHRQVRLRLPQRHRVRPSYRARHADHATARPTASRSGRCRSASGTSSDPSLQCNRNRPGKPGRFLLWRSRCARVTAQKDTTEAESGNERNHANPTDARLPTVNARIYPRGGLDVLSRYEVARLRDASGGGMHDLLRRCALAVLTSGSASDDPRAARELYPDFDIEVQQQDRGVTIDLRNAPAMAFVDGEIIRGVAELLFAVVRDLAYIAIETGRRQRSGPAEQRRHHRRRVRLLRNARVLRPRRSEPGGVLGRPLDLPRGVRLYQAGRLRAGPAWPRHLHRLRPGRDEGADEGRDHRPRQATHAAARATSASPSPGSSRPSRRTRSSTTW